MRGLNQVFGVLALLMIAAPAAAPKQKPTKENSQSSIVIIFKDGHEQSIPIADIARIEFTTPTSRVLPVGSARFLGDWKVGDGMGGTFIITLKPDGLAHKTNGGGGEGTWKVVHGEAQVSWDDGWHDVLRKVGNKYEKAAYSPGTSLNDKPSNIAEATYTEPN
jgi:hypothetical protein